MTITNARFTNQHCSNCREFTRDTPVYFDFNISYEQGIAGQAILDVLRSTSPAGMTDVDISVTFKINGEEFSAKSRHQYDVPDEELCELCKEKELNAEVARKMENDQQLLEAVKRENEMLKEEIRRLKGKGKATDLEDEERDGAFVGFSLDLGALSYEDDNESPGETLSSLSSLELCPLEDDLWPYPTQRAVSPSEEVGDSSAVEASNSHNKLFLPLKRTRRRSNDDDQ